MVALVDREQEEGVRLVDAVGGEPVEELLERLVVLAELRDIAGLTRRVCEVDVAGGPVLVVRVRDVRVGDGDSCLLHLGDPRE